MSLLHDTMRRTYAAQRGVSQGAHITLFAASAGYRATFECAQRCKEVLGSRNYMDFSIYSKPEIPQILIPTEDLHRSITKLAETFRIALVDTVTDDQGGTRFALVWRIAPTKRGTIAEEDMEHIVTKMNRGNEVNLDEY